MNRKSFDVTSLPDTIVIGRRTETGVLAVRFDCTAWFAYWPDLSISVLVTPPGGSMPYPARTYMDGKALVWDVSDIDTATEGFGTLEIMGKSAGRKKLSAIAKTQVLRTTSTMTTKPPEVTRTWLDQMIDTASEANEAANRAQSASSTAATSASSAASSASSAASSAARAESTAATTAERVTNEVLTNGTAANAQMFGNKPPEYYLPAENALTLEEIKASTDLTGKIPEANAVKDIANMLETAKFSSGNTLQQTGVTVPDRWGAVVRIRGQNWGKEFKSDSFFIHVTSGGGFYTGVQVNGATDITWALKG